MNHGAYPGEEQKARSPRKMAGQVLAGFFVLMLVLTLCSRALQEMSVAKVQSTRPQRGALERRVQSEGTLTAGQESPIIVPYAARITDVYVREGGSVRAGDPLLRLDYRALVKEKYEALEKAQADSATKRRDYNWAAADVNGASIDRMHNREEELEKAQSKRQTAQTEYDAALAAEAEAKKALDALQADYGAEASEEAALNAASQQHKRAVNASARAKKKLDAALKAEQEAKVKLDSFSKVRDYLTKKDLWEAAVLAEEAAGQAYAEILAQVDGAVPTDASVGEGNGDSVTNAGQNKQAEPVENAPSEEESSTKALPPYKEENEYISTVLAPVDGTARTVNAKAGALMDINTPAMLLSPAGSRLALEVEVEELQAQDMQVGDMADIVVDGNIHECAVQAISSAGEGKYKVRFDLPEGVGSTGMRASMHFRKRTQSYEVLVPLSALRNDAQGDFVYVVSRQETSLGASYTIARVPVTVMEKDATRAAVTGAISSRDTLVTRGDRELADGDRVRLAEE